MTTTGQLAGDGPAVQMDDGEERRIDERRLVEAFATHGGSKLAKRRHHGRWVDTSIEDITNNLLDEIQEMLDSHTREEARAECIDVALSAMILWDRLGREGE